MVFCFPWRLQIKGSPGDDGILKFSAEIPSLGEAGKGTLKKKKGTPRVGRGLWWRKKKNQRQRSGIWGSSVCGEEEAWNAMRARY